MELKLSQEFVKHKNRRHGLQGSVCCAKCADGDTNEYQTDAWISTAIAENVRVLWLSHVGLPQCCFKCKPLVQLTVEECTVSTEHGAVCLPRLKKLDLYSNYYENDESLPNLVSWCSAIENSVIERFTMGCDGVYMVSSYVCLVRELMA